MTPHIWKSAAHKGLWACSGKVPAGPWRHVQRVYWPWGGVVTGRTPKEAYEKYMELKE